MLENSAVGRCIKCGWALSFHPVKILVRPKEHGENATHIQIWESGCKCGESRFEEIEKRKR